jgi:hypothetical protein
VDALDNETGINTILMAFMGIQAAVVLHNKSFRSVIRAPMSFFDTTVSCRHSYTHVPVFFLFYGYSDVALCSCVLLHCSPSVASPTASAKIRT